MKRIFVLLALAAAPLAAATPASAGTVWTGVVVAKDNGRSAVVTASAQGHVRTARSPRARGLRIGQRVAVTGTKLADGTFETTKLRVTGRARTARVKAVVVKYQRAQRRLLVSAGGSTFALAGRRTQRSLASVSAETPAPGDQIVATVAVAAGTPQATSVVTVGHLATLEVEGIVTKLESGRLELLVAKAGFVTLALPAGFTMPAGVKVFDEVKLIVAVGTDGKLTLIAIQGDEAKDRDDDGVDFDEDGDKLKVEGTITAISATSVTVRPGSSASTVTCTLRRQLSGFALGDRVEMECFADATGTLVLRKIEHEDDDEDEDDTDDSDDTDDTDDDTDDTDD